jgi:flagellar hook-associated protein 2
MSVNTSISGISFSGISSGLDTSSIITALLQVDQIPINTLQTQGTTLNTTLSALQQFGQGLSALGAAANALSNSTAFSPVVATTSDNTVATVTTQTGGQAGNYNLSVTQLAQAEKISSAAQADTTSALSLSGTLVVNGKGVQIGGSDSLTTIAQKINGLSVGVTASIIAGGQGAAYLTLTSSSTGAANKIQIADLQGSVAGALGLTSGATSIRQPSAGGGAASSIFASETTPLATLLNGNSLGVQTFSLNGTAVTFDPSAGSLQDLANTINSASTGATASIGTSLDANGNTQYQLNLTGVTSYADTSGFLKGTGIVQQAYGKEILAAQDSNFSLDGIALTNSSNTVTGVIQGTTLNLLKGSVASPGTSTINISQDTTTIDKNVQSFVDTYNAIQTFVSQATTLDPTTFDTGPLFGNSAVDQITQQITTRLFDNVPGATPPYNNLAAVGFAIDQTGTLTFDSTKLNAALQANPSAVSALFRATGQGSNSAISFVSSSSNSVSSGASSYGVDITQVATQGSFTASAAQTQPLAANELLTFNGSLLGNSAYTLLLTQGQTQSSIVSQINSDAKLKNLVTASVQNGALVITSKNYGTNGNFTLTSDTPPSSSSSGIQGGTQTAGLDVAGTINGEAATGNGQFLTGNTGNATTDGLQIAYNGSTTGQVGSVTFSKGIGAQFNDMMNAFNDPTNGLLTAAENGITSQISDINDQITELQTEMANSKALLTTEFNNMEQALSQLKNQESSLSSILGGGTSSSTSTGTSSASSSSGN